jgi:5-methyltetrahydropteroyltriglutamate--homocysteine methyltransferase
MHIRPGLGYKNRLDLAWEFTEVINAELKALVDAGADYIQLDEPSFAVIPGELKEWVDLYNSSVKDVGAKLALHVCFGNLGSRPRGKRMYKWMFPELLDVNANQLVLEFANREMAEHDLWREFGVQMELGAGVIDVKSFYVETPEDVAERIRLLLKNVDPNRLYISPDCGFFQLPRWLAYLKLEAMVAGVNIVRRELGK